MPVSTSRLSQITSSGALTKENIAVRQELVNKLGPKGYTAPLPAQQPANTSPQDAPSKAPAAPKGNTKEIFTGLAEALNTWQAQLKAEGKIDEKDEYEIVFTPGLKDSKLTRPGETDKSKVPLQTNNSAKNLNPKTNSVSSNSRGMQVSAGTPIVQVIDQVMKNSTYITDQQILSLDAEGKATPTGKSPTGQTAWYNITVEATQLKYDQQRRDHAYHMKFVISPYAINTMQSNFFLNSRYRGSHKSYNYWFTGANDAIIHFEQNFNFLYRLIISGIGDDIKQKQRTDFRGRDQYRRVAVVTSEQSSQGNNGQIGEPGANASDFLYSPSDMATVKIRIVGDPAWMQQGEISKGVSERTFNFNPFNADGGINYDSQEVVFDISWNRPADYNMNTGLMEVTANNTKNNEPQENATYTAVTCKNFFSKGRFEQELVGKLLVEYETGNEASASSARPANSSVAATDSRPPLQAKGEALFNNYATKVLKVPESIVAPTPSNTMLSPSIIKEVTTLPASDPKPATSNGGIQNNNGNATPATFSQSIQQNTANNNTRFAQAIASQVLKNQNMATEK